SGTRRTAAHLRDGMVVLAAINTVGTAVELATLRHWKGVVQLIPWATLLVLAFAIALLVLATGPRVVRTVRALTVLVVVSSAFGMFEHIEANYRAGALDFRYAQRWPMMPATERWWAAVSKSVGPAPSFAPAVLAVAAICLFFATLDHPKLAAGASSRTGRAFWEIGPLARGRGPAAQRPVVRAASFILDLAARRAVTTAGEVRLTRTEWHVLEVLTRQPGELVGQRRLVEEVWGAANEPDERELRAFMAKLQSKLEPDPSRPRHLLSQPGAGFWFEPGLAGVNGSRTGGGGARLMP